MAPSEIARRQRNPARPSYCHLCCLPQPAVSIRPCWGEAAVFPCLWALTPVTGLSVRGTAQGAVKISTPRQEAAELQSQVCTKVMLWRSCLPKKSYSHIIFIPPTPNLTRLSVNPSNHCLHQRTKENCLERAEENTQSYDKRRIQLITLQENKSHLSQQK